MLKMENQSIFCLALFSILVQAWTISLNCPYNSVISPCTCRELGQGIEIGCDGERVNETSVENSFRELRRANGFPEDREVDVAQLGLQHTELTQFDLTTLYGSAIERLEIQYNNNLTKLINSGNPQDHGSIHVDWFHLYDARINESEFEDIFKYFSVQMSHFYASYLIINNNNKADEGEFLPGLSAFVNLNALGLSDCNISFPLTTSHFQAFPKLETIYLSSNGIGGIGENVFHPKVSYINLNGNQLNETSFHPESGIASNQTSRKSLYLESNQFTTLPSEIFQPFLSAHPQNTLYLGDNPLICDERLSWIKSQREEFQSRVKDAHCINDPGHTVFDSDLIP